MVVQAGIFWLNQGVAGLIATNFACGPDAMAGKLLGNLQTAGQTIAYFDLG